MNITRRNLLKAAAATTLTGMVGSTVTRTASAHADIDEEIVITMGEFFFQQEGKGKNEAIRIPANKVVRLVFKNPGAVVHDAHFGLEPDLAGRKYNKNLSAPFDMLELPVGAEAWVTFVFGDAQKGEWELGCFQPGHYEAGQKAPFIIE